MRERALGWRGIDSGVAGEPQLRVYASPENHSSIDKAIRLAGIGQQNLVKLPTDGSWALQPEALAHAMTNRRQEGQIRMQAGYDHSYFFVATFMPDHMEFHAEALGLA